MKKRDVFKKVKKYLFLRNNSVYYVRIASAQKRFRLSLKTSDIVIAEQKLQKILDDMELLSSNLPSYVYCLKDAAGHLKVGRAKDIAERMVNIQIGNAHPLSFCFAFHSKDARVDENKVHAMLNTYSMSNEWYCCTEAKVKKIFEDIATNNTLTYELEKTS